MAQALGVVGTIVGVPQFNARVTKYLDDVKNASKDCNRILVEIRSVSCYVYTLKDLVESSEPVLGLKKAGKAFLWPLKKGDVADILLTIERQKTLFILDLQNDHLQSAQAIQVDLVEVKHNLSRKSTGIQMLERNSQDEHLNQIFE
ncbi:MAG: hypothetical protein M1827_004855 [Pycnora praestabilis]|nr:MAG: hypothetical protein M1827_004855 [Pycnora praestabilis]